MVGVVDGGAGCSCRWQEGGGVGLEQIMWAWNRSWGCGTDHGGIKWIMGTWNGLWAGETDCRGMERMVGTWNGLWGCGTDLWGVELIMGTWNGWWGGETDGGGVEQIVGGRNRWWGGGGAHCYVVVTFIAVCWWAVIMGSCCPPVGGFGCLSIHLVVCLL
jgi:hypothetical protein